jgi:hypothetical protein
MTSEVPIKHKDLWESRGNLKLDDWFRACKKLSLPITQPGSGTSHYAVRHTSDPIDLTTEGLISTIYEGMSKQVNGKVFRRFLECGVEEDALWKALGKL